MVSSVHAHGMTNPWDGQAPPGLISSEVVNTAGSWSGSRAVRGSAFAHRPEMLAIGPLDSIRGVRGPAFAHQPSVIKPEPMLHAQENIERDEKAHFSSPKFVAKHATSSKTCRMPYLRRDSSVVLRQWFEENQDKRYPSSEVKKQLAAKSVQPRDLGTEQ